MENVKKDVLWRVYLVYFIVMVTGIAILARILFIQNVEGKELEEKAISQSIRNFEIKAARGNIYSEDHSLLATSVPEFDLFWDAVVVHEDTFRKNIDQLATDFHQLFPSESKASFEQRMRNAFKNQLRYYKVRKKVSYAELKAIRNMPIFNKGKYKGGLIDEKYEIRNRPYKMLAKRTIGHYNKALDTFKVGLEAAYNDQLTGTDGVRIKQRTIGGWKPLYLFDETVKEPKNGNDIITTIDINIQDVAETSLMNHLLHHQADWGCAVLMEVETGHIKAIANLTLDTASGRYYEKSNHAVGTQTDAGSTFKLASIMVALEDKKVKPNDLVDCGNGIFKYYGATMRDSHRGGYGKITVNEVFEKSSNVGVFKIVLDNYENKPQDFVDKLYAMGLNNKLGIEIKGEPQPFIKSTDDPEWSKLSLPWMAVGYEMRITPLQILSFYNAVANDGSYVKPLFVKAVSNTGQIIEEFKTEILNKQIARPEVIEQAQYMLEGVVQRGTAQRLKHSPYRIAGKTGTAQITETPYDHSDYRASFVGYFPADKPKYSCIVVVSNPTGGIYYASQVAVPVFKDIADRIYANELDLHEEDTLVGVLAYPSSKVGDRSDILNLYQALDIPYDKPDSDSQWLHGVDITNKVGFYEREITEKEVPNLKGMNARDAIYLVEQKGLKVVIHGKGKVSEQSLPAGQKINQGDLIHLYLKG